jgi:hypothetical protein
MDSLLALCSGAWTLEYMGLPDPVTALISIVLGSIETIHLGEDDSLPLICWNADPC